LLTRTEVTLVSLLQEKLRRKPIRVENGLFHSWTKAYETKVLALLQQLKHKVLFHMRAYDQPTTASFREGLRPSSLYVARSISNLTAANRLGRTLARVWSYDQCSTAELQPRVGAGRIRTDDLFVRSEVTLTSLPQMLIPEKIEQRQNNFRCSVDLNHISFTLSTK
jgi:hypothetical protein